MSWPAANPGNANAASRFPADTTLPELARPHAVLPRPPDSTIIHSAMGRAFLTNGPKLQSFSSNARFLREPGCTQVAPTLANVRAQMRSEDDELCSARQFRHGVEVVLADIRQNAAAAGGRHAERVDVQRLA